MKLLSVKFRCMVPPPDAPLKATGTLNDVFEAPEYAIETRGEHWLRITHASSGKSRVYPQGLCIGADELPQETQHQPQYGRRR